MITIEKGITKGGNFIKRSHEFRNALLSMEVGDSFMEKCPKGKNLKSFHSQLLSKCIYHAARGGSMMKFTSSAEANGIRIWRKE